MKKSLIAGALIALFSTLPSLAMAQSREAYTTRTTQMLAGPDFSFPTITHVSRNSDVYVYGCLRDWSWCDVRWRGERGWIDARDLKISRIRNNSEVYFLGSNSGFPIISFILGNYWNDHYRHRSWYRDMNRWRDYRPLPPPAHRPGRPNVPPPGFNHGRPDVPPPPAHRPGRPDVPPPATQRPGRPDVPPPPGFRREVER